MNKIMFMKSQCSAWPITEIKIVIPFAAMYDTYIGPVVFKYSDRFLLVNLD